MEALAAGFAEAIALGPDGRLSEGSGQNVFLVYRGTVFTPTINGTLCAAYIVGFLTLSRVLPADLLAWLQFVDVPMFLGKKTEPERTVSDRHRFREPLPEAPLGDSDARSRRLHPHDRGRAQPCQLLAARQEPVSPESQRQRALAVAMIRRIPVLSAAGTLIQRKRSGARSRSSSCLRRTDNVRRSAARRRNQEREVSNVLRRRISEIPVPAGMDRP